MKCTIVFPKCILILQNRYIDLMTRKKFSRSQKNITNQICAKVAVAIQSFGFCQNSRASKLLWAACTNIDPNLIADQRNF